MPLGFADELLWLASGCAPELVWLLAPLFVLAVPLISELLLGLLEGEVPGVVLVEDCDCDDCDPQFEFEDALGELVALEELLDCGVLEFASGVEVLELLDDVWLLLDWSCAMKLLCGGVAPVVSDFGVVLLGELLFGEAEGVVLLAPALPEMLPAVFWSAGVAELFAAFALLTVMSSFTFLTPATDFASFLASFLSSLVLTEPVNFTVPLSTATWTF